MEVNSWHGIEIFNTVSLFVKLKGLITQIDHAYIRSNSKIQQVYYVMCLIQLRNSYGTYAE